MCTYNQNYNIALQIAVNKAIIDIYADDTLVLIEFDSPGQASNPTVVAIDTYVINILTFTQMGFHLVLHTRKVSQMLHLEVCYHDISQIISYSHNMNYKQVLFERTLAG